MYSYKFHKGRRKLVRKPKEYCNYKHIENVYEKEARVYDALFNKSVDDERFYVRKFIASRTRIPCCEVYAILRNAGITDSDIRELKYARRIDAAFADRSINELRGMTKKMFYEKYQLRDDNDTAIMKLRDEIRDRDYQYWSLVNLIGVIAERQAAQEQQPKRKARKTKKRDGIGILHAHPRSV